LRADALVSLHRAEGFGLVIAEAMALGVPVIATGYSGNLDFCLPGCVVLIPWQPVALPATAGDYPAGATWAEPDVDAAAAAMAQLAADRRAADALGERGRQAVLERLAPERLAGIIRQRLGSHLLPPDSGAAAAG
jgi:glycosyltransferase involved in cell wall biosynthesis